MTQLSYKFLFDVEEANQHPVFYDPRRVRKKRFRRLVGLVVFTFFLWIGVFFWSTLPMGAIVDELRFWWNIDSVSERVTTPEREAKTPETQHQGFFVRAARASANAQDACSAMPQGVLGAKPDGTDHVFFGHVPTALEWAPLSLKKSCGTLNVLIPDWLSVVRDAKAAGASLAVVSADASTREPIDAYLKTAATPPALMPTVALDAEQDLDGLVAQMTDTAAAAGLVGDLVASAQRLDAIGLCLDFKQLDDAQMAKTAPFLSAFGAGMKQGGLQSCVIVGAQQAIWQDRTLMQGFDKVILKAFVEPWVGSPPSPLAADTWFADVAAKAVAAIGPERLTIAIGNFASEWTTRQPLPETLPVVEAWKRIDDAKAKLNFGADVGNGFASFRDRARGSHKLWLLDAVSAHNQIRTLNTLGVRNIALWSLGREDPGVWPVLAAAKSDTVEIASHLKQLRYDNYVSYTGKGAFLRVLDQPRDGARDVDVDAATGRITDVRYTQFPRPYLLERYGQPAPNKLVLTFDDGPDPVYTKAILDTLRETQTPGAFFVVGSRVMEEPDLLNRMIAEGHEIGAHTFSHPRMDLVSQARAELEHRMSARVIAGYSGHKTQLYREPFLRAGGPIEEARVHSLERVQLDGGIIAGMEVVPKDWLGLSATEIADFVIDEVNKGTGNVILLHDGGDDRTASVNALPRIIRELREQGYEFTTLADFLGTDRAALMPEVTGQWLIFDRLTFTALSVTWFSLETIFWIVLLIGVLRTLFILVLAALRRRTRPISTDQTPKVSVVIPAFNEQGRIKQCIESVLASDYPNFDVIVVDDGSQDETFNDVLCFQRDRRVYIFAQLNQGKWAALNAAIANTKSEILVCIDADTVIDPQAIGHLARQFSNPRVGAVAGKISVANRRNLLTRLQALEYITAQNFDRRAFDLANGIFVVPGAIGAWRTQAVREAGRYRNDTLTEDADLTINVNRAGYRVTYEEKAIAFTQAPETVRQLLGQRLRWSLGMFQCTWKHKKAIFEGRSIGMLSIPDMLIFGYLFPLLAPIADAFVLVLLYKLFAGNWSGEVGGAVSDTPTHLIFAYMVLPLLDFIVAAFALKTDGRESLRMLWLFPFQRFFYRQLLYFSVYRSVLRAVTGTLAGWGRVKTRKRVLFRKRMA
ncbi:glycosyltransferase [Rhodobacteraceae bacterium D3-12]|nr:glycosyltransferase [Rhodobacteraceae bacterium D3-12]